MFAYHAEPAFYHGAAHVHSPFAHFHSAYNHPQVALDEFAFDSPATQLAEANYPAFDFDELDLMHLADDGAAAKDPYFTLSKELYKNQKTRIEQEFKLRQEWIKDYSQEKALDTQLLKEWKTEAMKILNHSNISPEARKAVKQYLTEQKQLHDALDRDEAKEEKADEEAEQALIKRNEVGHCWNKVDFLEQTWLHTYMTADDDEFGQTLFKQAKKHLDQQVKECQKIEKGNKK